MKRLILLLLTLLITNNACAVNKTSTPKPTLSEPAPSKATLSKSALTNPTLFTSESMTTQGDNQLFTNLINLGQGKYLMLFRKSSRSGELGDGSIYYRTFDESAMSWSKDALAFDEGLGRNCLSPHGEIIDGVVKFLVHCKDQGPTALHGKTYLVKSTGLTLPLTWNSGTQILTAQGGAGSNIYSPHWIATDDPDKFLLTVNNTAAEYPGVQFIGTTDRGEHWSYGDAVYKPHDYQEADLTYLGEGVYFGLIRKNEGSHVQQFYSTDHGKTFSPPIETNLGAASGIKVAYLKYDRPSETLMAVYLDRGNASHLCIGFGKLKTVMANPTAWTESKSHVTGGLGYGDMVELDANNMGKKTVLKNVTKATNTCPVVITLSDWTGHRLKDGDSVTFADVGGMTELNGNTYAVKNSGRTTIALYDQIAGTDLDGTNFGTYTSGGTASVDLKFSSTQRYFLITNSVASSVNTITWTIWSGLSKSTFDGERASGKKPTIKHKEN